MFSIIMGSKSDWPIMKFSSDIFNDFNIKHEIRALSAHRTPMECSDYVSKLEDRGFSAVIAAAGGAAHLPGVVASKTTIPVLGVPIDAGFNNGIDSLFSIVQMPGGIPVATFSVGKAGAKNAALFAISLIALKDKKISKLLKDFRNTQRINVIKNSIIENK